MDPSQAMVSSFETLNSSEARDPDHVNDNNGDVDGDHGHNSSSHDDDSVEDEDDYNSSCNDDVDYDLNTTSDDDDKYSQNDDGTSDNEDDGDGERDYQHSRYSDEERYNDEDDDDYGYSERDYEPRHFQRAFSCYPVSSVNMPHLEEGNRIVMPPSSLEALDYLMVKFPMMFELRGHLYAPAEPLDADATEPAEPRVSHCGVMEFTADEGTVYMPQWMMENLHLEEGSIVHIKNVTLQSATYLKLQPHSKDFLSIQNPKAMLEMALRGFACLTEGDTIVLPYNNKNYVIEIIETKPDKAVSIIETDCEADFAPPLDYVEPVPKPVKEEEVTKEEPKDVWFTGVARRCDEKPCSTSKAPNASSRELKSEKSEIKNDYVQPVANPVKKEEAKKEEPNNVWFTGVVRRCGEKPCSTSEVSSQELKSDDSEIKKGETSALRGGSSCRPSGKLVFGSDVSQSGTSAPSVKAAAKNTNPEPANKEEKKFQAFTGKGRKLQ